MRVEGSGREQNSDSQKSWMDLGLNLGAFRYTNVNRVSSI